METLVSIIRKNVVLLGVNDIIYGQCFFASTSQQDCHYDRFVAYVKG